MASDTNQQKMPPKKALSTLRRIIEAQPLARQRQDDPGHKAWDDAHDALAVLKCSVDELETAREERDLFYARLQESRTQQGLPVAAKERES